MKSTPTQWVHQIARRGERGCLICRGAGLSFWSSVHREPCRRVWVFLFPAEVVVVKKCLNWVTAVQHTAAPWHISL